MSEYERGRRDGLEQAAQLTEKYPYEESFYPSLCADIAEDIRALAASHPLQDKPPAASVTVCPKCGGRLNTSGGHGEWCPKATCKWGWEVEADGSPLQPPLPAAPGAVLADAILRRIAMRYKNCKVHIFPDLPELTPVEAVLRCAQEEGFHLTNAPAAQDKPPRPENEFPTGFPLHEVPSKAAPRGPAVSVEALRALVKRIRNDELFADEVANELDALLKGK